MTVLVAVPFYGKPELLPRAVESVLAQTVTDLVCCVYGDGMAIPSLPDDARLRPHVSEVNRGPYFGLEVMLKASPYEYFAPLGADDWIDPDHLARLLRYRGDVAPGVVWWHDGTVRRRHRGVYEVGLFRTSTLRGIGGYNPAERIGQDSLILRLLRLTGHLKVATHPTYHRVRHPDTLTTAPQTGHRSPARREVRARNRAVAAQAQRFRHDLRGLRAYRESLVPPAVRAQVSAEALALAL